MYADEKRSKGDVVTRKTEQSQTPDSAHMEKQVGINELSCASTFHLLIILVTWNTYRTSNYTASEKVLLPSKVLKSETMQTVWGKKHHIVILESYE